MKETKRKIPFWFKAGLISVCLFLIIAAFDFAALCNFGSHSGESCGFLLIIASIPIFPLTSKLFPSGFTWYIGTIFLTIPLYFTAGAILSSVVVLLFKK